MNIAIRGTGKFGKYIAGQLKKKSNYNIVYFIDANADLWGRQVEGIPVISPEDFQDMYQNKVDFVLVAYMNSMEGFKQIVTSENIKYGFICNRVLEAKMQLQENLRKDGNIIWSDAPYLNKPILRSLETNIVDDCNLNCRGCSHFSNLYERGAHIPFETFCKDMAQVAKNVYIHQLNMLGGEAILNDRIIEYIEFARALLPHSQIQLISNGLLLPRQSEEFYRSCRENDITISISGYKPTLLIKDKIKEVLEMHRITYIFREDVTEFGKNIDLTGSANVQEAVKCCRESRCHFLREGRIYKCPFEALGNKFFSHFDVDIRFDGGTDIYDPELDWEALIDKLHFAPIDACRYCGKEEKIDWKVENNPSIEDWII